MNTIEITIPDSADFIDAEVAEVLVAPGDKVETGQPLVVLYSGKTRMEIQAACTGIIRGLNVSRGDRISRGSVLLSLISDETPIEANMTESVNASNEFPTDTQSPVTVAFAGKADIECDTVVLGAGPGGYTAAFRAADLGQNVVLVERYPVLGGVCLNVGCIPSKALLHAAKVITDAEEMAPYGIHMGKPEIDVRELRRWKSNIISRLTGGLDGLAKARKVQIVQGVGAFTSPETLEVETQDGMQTIKFKHAIIAAGSSAVRIPGFPHGHPGLIDSTGALELRKIPQRMLIIGGGIIGLEMACVYDALGAKVSVVEMADGLIPIADRDLLRPLQRRIQKRYEAIYLNTKVARLEAQGEQLLATFEGKEAPAEPQLYDMVLMAVGRRPNGKQIGAERAGVTVDEDGFITVDKQQRTNVPHIYAIGDICGEPMLAHKASHEGRIAAEVIAGLKVAFDAKTIPSVAYTDPEVAWMGLTENEAREQGIEYERSGFPWVASGRAQAMGRDEGMTKLLWDPKTKRILGAGIVGVNAGELLAETVLALEMGADLDDIAHTIHAHPSLSETPMFAAEMGLGTITDLYVPKK